MILFGRENIGREEEEPEGLDVEGREIDSAGWELSEAGFEEGVSPFCCDGREEYELAAELAREDAALSLSWFLASVLLLEACASDAAVSVFDFSSNTKEDRELPLLSTTVLS